MFRTLILFGLILSLSINSGFCQFQNDYTPLSYSKIFPDNFTENYQEKIKTASEAEESLTKKTAKSFYEALYMSKAQFFSSGQIYFDNRLSKYVKDVASKLFANNPGLLNKVKIYVARSTSANAWAMADGTVVINVGLLARLENEAQLAAIIAHEVSHVDLNHSIKAISKMAQIKSQQENYVNDEGEIFRSLKYSREDEFEADSRAVQLLLASQYDPKEVPKALSILGNDDYFKVDSLENTLRNYVFFDLIKVDTNWFAKTEYSDREDKSDIVFGKGNDDLYSTHPDIAKRVSAANEILNLIDFKGDGRSVNLLNNESSEIKSIAQFECIEGMMKNLEYNTALYLALYSLQKYPDNIYLKTIIVKNLYWLSFYKEINSINTLFENSGYACKENFDMFNSFLVEIPHNDLKKLMFGYLKKNLEVAQSRDEYYFYYGLCSEMYLGKDPSRLIYSQYLLKFPSGKYSTTVKAKLQ